MKKSGKQYKQAVKRANGRHAQKLKMQEAMELNNKFLRVLCQSEGHKVLTFGGSTRTVDEWLKILSQTKMMRENASN